MRPGSEGLYYNVHTNPFLVQHREFYLPLCSSGSRASGIESFCKSNSILGLGHKTALLKVLLFFPFLEKNKENTFCPRSAQKNTLHPLSHGCSTFPHIQKKISLETSCKQSKMLRKKSYQIY